MKNDPYARLGGLDQQLFQREPKKEPAKQSNNVTTLSRSNEPTTDRSGDASPRRDNEKAKHRVNVPSTQRGNEATRTRASSPKGLVTRSRIQERHSHDIYQDQVRWINRLKVDIEETHGAKLTGNQVVQLAIDLIRADYERHGEDSALIRRLVKGEPANAEIQVPTEPESV